MTASDRRIGRNLSALRGARSQASLASAMRAEGWKWSQPTVAAIEKGERPLKLAEAESLAVVLGLEQLEDLIERPADAITAAAVSKMDRAADDLLDAVLAFWDAQFALANTLDEVSARGELDSSPGDGNTFTRWLLADPSTVIDVAHPFVPVKPETVDAVSPNGETPWMRVLAGGPYGERSRFEKGPVDGTATNTAE